MPSLPVKRSSSGRFCSESVLTLNRSSEPWIVFSDAAESGTGSRLSGAIGCPEYANGLIFVSSGIGRYSLSCVSTILKSRDGVCGLSVSFCTRMKTPNQVSSPAGWAVDCGRPIRYDLSSTSFGFM